MEILQPKNPEELAKLFKSIDSKSLKLDTSMNTGIVAIDHESLTVTVRTGTTWRELRQALRDDMGGRRYEPCIYPRDDLISLEEWLQADGMNIAGFKFGLTGRSLYDIEIVTFQGELLNLGFKTTVYSSLGYVLKRIFLGSNYTLGVTTECIMQIRRIPELQAGIKIDLTPDIDIKEILTKVNLKTLRPTLVFVTQNVNQQLVLYFLFDGMRRVVNAQLNVLNTIISGYPGLMKSEVSYDQILARLYEKGSENLVFYLISPEKFKELLDTFSQISKAYILNPNTILVAFDLNKLNVPEASINSKVLELKGKKAYINPLNSEELVMFGDERTPELIQKIRTAFDLGASSEVPVKKSKGYE